MPAWVGGNLGRKSGAQGDIAWFSRTEPPGERSSEAILANCIEEKTEALNIGEPHQGGLFRQGHEVRPVRPTQ